MKGPTVLNGEERADILRAIKWGDIVVPDTPYEVTTSVLDDVNINCQYYIHGDDPVMCNGENICEIFQGLGRFKEIKRTTGVSTTDLTGKLLNLIKAPSTEEIKQEGEGASAHIVNPPK